MKRLAKIYCYFSTILLFISGKANAQVIENTINLYGVNFPQEKIHIHFDRESYLPGETIWFKAYVFEEYLPSARSTNFYASLYDDNGKLIQQQLCPIFNGSSNGYFKIPDSIKSKQLICRAYTSWMLNFDTAFLFSKAIKLIKNDEVQDTIKPVKTISLQFFPEGGDIIEGIKNTIAFKVNDNNGLPFEIEGVIKKQSSGEVIMPIKSVHDGMGKFDIDISANEKFYAEWKDNTGIMQRSYLPVAKPAGVSLKVVQQKSNIIFNIINKLANDSLHVLMYMYQKVFYKKDMAVSFAQPFTTTVAVNTLPTGIAQLTVFDVNWQPVAERVCFINNNNYEFNVLISNNEINITKKGKNTIEIAIADTIPANMSLSITDATFNDEKTTTTIATNLLLSGDVKGYINNPAYYFSDAAGAKSNLDLVMLTHGWRRYNWDNMLAAKMPEIKYPTDNYLSAYGQIGKEALQKIDTSELVNLILKTKDSTQSFYTVKPQSNGLINQPGFIFYDTAQVLYSFNKNKLLNSQIVFSTSNLTYPQQGHINVLNNFFNTDTSITLHKKSTSLLEYYAWENNSKKNEKTLSVVKVKNGLWRNWKYDPLYKMDQKYAGFGFSGWDGFGIDVLHDLKADPDVDIFQYVVDKAPSLTIEYKDGARHLVNFVGKQGPVLFIDDYKADEDDVYFLKIEDIAYIKYNNHVVVGTKIFPAICFYRKKGADLIDRRPKDTDLKMIKLAGYSPIKEFYSPDYSKSNTASATDARITLLWQPYILTDATNRKIPITFYNNDFTKKIRVTLEGMNDEGKIIHLEKIIE